MQTSYILESTQKRYSDVQKISHQVKGSLGQLQSQLETDRGTFAEQQIQLEWERYWVFVLFLVLEAKITSTFLFIALSGLNFMFRFKKKRTMEELEAVKRKAALVQAQKEGSIVPKLEEELKEYKEIVKCSICLERPKEVNYLTLEFQLKGVKDMECWTS